MFLSTGGLRWSTHDGESRKMVPYRNSVSWVLLCTAWPAWYIPQGGTYSGLDLLHYKFYLKLTPIFTRAWSPQQHFLCQIIYITQTVNSKNTKSEGYPVDLVKDCIFLLICGYFVHNLLYAGPVFNSSFVPWVLKTSSVWRKDSEVKCECLWSLCGLLSSVIHMETSWRLVTIPEKNTCVGFSFRPYYNWELHISNNNFTKLVKSSNAGLHEYVNWTKKKMVIYTVTCL